MADISEAQAAFSFCENLAKTHYENFTVASWLLPAAKKQHFYALYAFCRSVDDAGDEVDGDRFVALQLMKDELALAFGKTSPRHPAFIALQCVIRTHSIPRPVFEKLIEANVMDQRLKRYPAFDDLLFYCQHSANPVGRMVLGLWDHFDDERVTLSDQVCTGLQLANFWQDVSRDLSMNRIYIPQEDLRNFDVSEADLADTEKAPKKVCELLKFQVERTRGFFDRGEKLLKLIELDLQTEVELFIQGGRSILDAIEDQDFDVLGKRPSISPLRKMALVAKAGLKFATSNVRKAGAR